MDSPPTPDTRSDEIPADAQKPVAYISAVGGEIVEWRECPVLRDLEDAVGGDRAGGRRGAVEVSVRGEHERPDRVTTFLDA